MKHILSMEQLTTNEINQLLIEADQFSQGKEWKPTNPIFVANLFFEPSTRTKCSFELAERRLGLQVIPFEVGFSSVLKGETLYDTVKTLQSIGISSAVIRHEKNRYYDELQNINIPIINGGDGCGDHPTQSLLDLLTIKQEFQHFHNLHVAIIGDIRHSRVAHSDAEALTRLGARVSFSGPKQWFDEVILKKGMYLPVDEAIQRADVVMLLRIQHERHQTSLQMSKEEYHQMYGLTKEREKRMKRSSIIMHPAPVNRDVEIASSLVECERSRIFKQMENGVYIRMAALKTLLQMNTKMGDEYETTYQKRVAY